MKWQKDYKGRRFMFLSMRKSGRTPEKIRTMVVERLRQELPGHALRVEQDNPFRLQLFHPEAGDLVLNLGNLVHEIHESTPAAAEQMITAYVSMAKQALCPPSIDLTKVFPSLRHHEFLNAIDTADDDPLVGEGPGDLVSVVLADQGDVVATLTQDIAEADGHTSQDILHAAEKNFVALLPREVYVAERESGVLSVGLESHPWLGTSLLFVPSIISQLMAHYGWSRAHVSAPTRDTVDLVNADAPNALAYLERWLLERLAEPRSQSEFVLTMASGDELLTTTHRMSGGRLLGLN